MQEDDVVVALLKGDTARDSFKMKLHGGRDQVAGTIAAATWESFERPFPSVFFKCAKKWNGIIVDVGANTGFYTLLGACASVKNSIIAFEPDHLIMRSLEENVTLSELIKQVSMSTLALSNVSGSAVLYVPTQEHGLIETSSSLEKGFKSEHSELRKIEVETLDNFMLKNENLSKKVSLIKIDVEGHEWSVLEGSKSTIAKHRPILFVEIIEEKNLKNLTEFFRSNDYTDYPLSPDGISANTGQVRFVPDAWNHAFVPKEKADAFAQMTAEPPSL